MKKLVLFFSVFVLLLACKKPDKTTNENPTAKVTYTLDSSSTQPGVFLTIKSNSPITRDTATIQFADKQLLLCKIDSFQYAFIVPVVDPGKYPLDLTKINGTNSPEITVRNYNTITNPGVTINTIVNDYHKLVDSIEKRSFPNSVSSTDIAFMHQIMNQVSDNINALSPEQKLLAAYQLQQLDFDRLSFHWLKVDTTYIARIQMPEDEPGQQLSENSLLTSLINNGATASGWLMVATGIAFVNSGAPNLLVAFTISASIYFALKANAKSSSTQLDSFAGIAKGNLIKEEDGVNTVQFTDAQSSWQKFQSSFRNIQASDRGGANTTISDVIISSEELQAGDIKVKHIFDKARNIASHFFDKIDLSYDLYVNPIAIQGKEKIAQIKNQFISITAVSNPDIQLTASDDGPNGLKISATNPSNNITVQTDFSFELTYTQEALNNKITITQTAVFIPSSEDSTFIDPRDGQVYTYKRIGTQIWMTQNLNYAAPGSSCYDNNAANCAVYGRLYDWNTALTVAPPGWHLPSDAEWQILLGYLGGIYTVAGGKMKEIGTTRWASPNTGADNSSGFTGLPGGVRGRDGLFYYIGSFGFWWSSTPEGPTAWGRTLIYNDMTLGRGNHDTPQGFSVRCIKD